MEVQLYVYDLSSGLARNMSLQFLGKQIDAVYHTSLVFGNIEYFFGLGVQTCYPGSTHHGRPMEIIPLGETALPMEIILEYLESLKQIYTAESYDLFAHNCNNFTNDFATFLIGKGIPEHITSLPKTVLETPFGQMLKPQIDNAMRATTQAPLPPQAQAPISKGTARSRAAQAASNGSLASKSSALKANGEVYNVTALRRLNELLESAKDSCAVIFFTSATCPPCKLVYPVFDELATEAEGKCYLIKVDVSQAHEIGQRYDVRATPTFISFLKGKREGTWTGASPATLKGSVRMLVMSAFPMHLHERLNIPTFRRQTMRPVLYTKVPPLEKLTMKMGEAAKETGIISAVAFVKRRIAESVSQEVQLPDMSSISETLQRLSSTLPAELRFTVYDILRLMLVEPRASGYFLSSPETRNILEALFENAADESSLYNLQLCALHAACNLFSPTFGMLLSSGLLADGGIVKALITLISTGFQDTNHVTLRVAAASLAFNIATQLLEARMSSSPSSNAEAMPEASQVELAAALMQAIGEEADSADVVKLAALSLGRLLYLQPANAEIRDLYDAMDAKEVLASKTKLVKKEDRILMHEIEGELLGKGLK